MSGRRWMGVLSAATLGVVSVGAICAGALAAVVSSAGTYVDLGAHGTFRTDRYGLATDSTNWRSQLLGWAGSVRLEVASAGAKPIFVGVAPSETIARYLSGTGYTTVGEHTRTDHRGAAPARPVGAVRWTAHEQGTGTLTLRWSATDRRQVALAMNADGTRPVRVRVVSSAVTLDRMPWWVPAVALAFGFVLLPPGIIVLRRRRRARRGS